MLGFHSISEAPISALVPVAGGGDTLLVLADATQGHTVDNILLTLAYTQVRLSCDHTSMRRP